MLVPTSQERSLKRLGLNLQLLLKRLGANQKLLRYLFYSDEDPLSPEKIDVTFKDVWQKNILPVPIIGTKDDSTSVISLKVLNGVEHEGNSEFIDVFLNIEVFVPITQWILKSDNMRPFLIMGEILESLDGKKIEGLGNLTALNFSINFLTEEMSCYEMQFYLTQFK